VETRELEIRELDGGRVALSGFCEGRIETSRMKPRFVLNGWLILSEEVWSVPETRKDIYTNF